MFLLNKKTKMKMKKNFYSIYNLSRTVMRVGLALLLVTSTSSFAAWKDEIRNMGGPLSNPDPLGEGRAIQWQLPAGGGRFSDAPLLGYRCFAWIEGSALQDLNELEKRLADAAAYWISIESQLQDSFSHPQINRGEINEIRSNILNFNENLHRYINDTRVRFGNFCSDVLNSLIKDGTSLLAEGKITEEEASFISEKVELYSEVLSRSTELYNQYKLLKKAVEESLIAISSYNVK
jgi:hypothetical protein